MGSVPATINTGKQKRMTAIIFSALSCIQGAENYGRRASAFLGLASAASG
jgi:hypothetical protein